MAGGHRHSPVSQQREEDPTLLKPSFHRPNNAFAATHRFTGGARFEEFLNNNTNVLVPKVGMRWQPFGQELTLRSTWGEGYRQPSLEELFSAPISTLFGTRDPLNGGVFEPETNTLIQSNPNLQPEDSRSFSAGFVYTPKGVPGLTVSVDFWDIERIGWCRSTPSRVLDREASGSLLPGLWCDRIPVYYPVLLSNQNLGNQRLSGMTLPFSISIQRHGGRSPHLHR